jgi:hypothetical protein
MINNKSTIYKEAFLKPLPIQVKNGVEYASIGTYDPINQVYLKDNLELPLTIFKDKSDGDEISFPGESGLVVINQDDHTPRTFRGNRYISFQDMRNALKIKNK